MSLRLPMKTAADARRTLSRLIREYRRGELDPVMYRGLVYGMGVLLGYFKLEQDTEILRGIDELRTLAKEKECATIQSL